MKAYEHLIRHAARLGYTFVVDYGDDYDSFGDDVEGVIEAIKGVDEADVAFFNKGEYIGTAVVSDCDLADDETVIDYTVFPWLDAWWNAYEEGLDGAREGDA